MRRCDNEGAGGVGAEVKRAVDGLRRRWARGRVGRSEGVILLRSKGEDRARRDRERTREAMVRGRRGAGSEWVFVCIFILAEDSS